MTDPEAASWNPPPANTPASVSTARPPTDALPLMLTLALTVLAYLLTRGAAGTLGLNVLLIVAALLGTLLTVLYRRGQSVNRAALVLLGLGSLCALGLTLRDGPLMDGLNLLGLFTALGLGIAHLRVPGLTRLSVGQMLLVALWNGLRVASELLASALRFPWARLRAGGLTRHFHTEQSRRVLTGLLLTLPLLLVFGALLGGADARFGQLIARLFRWTLPAWNTGELAFTFLQLVFWAFLLGGPVYAGLLATRAAPDAQVAHTPRLGLTELGLPLLSTSLLFCTYLTVQASNFFGTRLPGGLTYSQAAWQGFGALTAVATLTLVVLLLAHTLLRRELRTGLPYRLLSGAVLLPLTLLIVSAYQRLALYVAAYGLSEIRVLGTVFLAWVTLSLLTYSVLLWRGGLERFAYFSLISGLGLIVGLNGVNPGRLIATVNLNRMLEAAPATSFDSTRAATNQGTLVEVADLGPDALPVLLAHLNARGSLSVRVKDDALMCALARNNRPEFSDWRLWNLARRSATQLMSDLEGRFPLPLWEECRVSYDD